MFHSPNGGGVSVARGAGCARYLGDALAAKERAMPAAPFPAPSLLIVDVALVGGRREETLAGSGSNRQLVRNLKRFSYLLPAMSSLW